jgi:hypothetical protein
MTIGASLTLAIGKRSKMQAMTAAGDVRQRQALERMVSRCTGQGGSMCMLQDARVRPHYFTGIIYKSDKRNIAAVVIVGRSSVSIVLLP